MEPERAADLAFNHGEDEGRPTKRDAPSQVRQELLLTPDSSDKRCRMRSLSPPQGPKHFENRPERLTQALISASHEQVASLLSGSRQANQSLLADCFMERLEPPLCLAIRRRVPLDMIKLLLSKGADVTLADVLKDEPAMVLSKISKPNAADDPASPYFLKVPFILNFEEGLREASEKMEARQEQWILQVAHALVWTGGCRPMEVRDGGGRTLECVARSHGQDRLANFWRYAMEERSLQVMWRAVLQQQQGCPLVTQEPYLILDIYKFLLPEDVIQRIAKV